MYGGGVFCGLSLHYDSTITLLIVNDIVIVTIDLNVNNDSDQYTILSLIYLYGLCLKTICGIKMRILLLIYCRIEIVL